MSEEEIINVIETVIRANRFDGVYTSVDIILESMKGLLDLYNILKEKYNFTIKNNLDDKYEEVLEKTLKKYLDKDFISKDKIREKIKELDNMFECSNEEINHRLRIEDNAKKQVLEELLEE